ncbi:GIY-YIG nuclease family protein [Trueperella pyogenes]|uniref:GIY-YIG nuclease family protein n=1 Tax=Trueperella pyogenes TaxID=1661 RepID=UPI003251305A
MANPKTVQLFLIDGTARGPLKATISNWTGITYLIPRTEIDALKDRPDLNQTGVYLLFGTDDDDDVKVYIGQARERKNRAGVLGRIAEHIGEEKRDYWTHAVAFVTSNNSFGPTEISYLENQFTNLARRADRFEVTNGNEPSPGTVTEEKKQSLTNSSSTHV